MKHITVYIILLSLLSFQFSELLILASFKINQDYIAKNLCVEKDIEGSTCKGCCQLEKRISEQDEKKKKVPAAVTEKLEINLFVDSNSSLTTIFTEELSVNSAYLCNYTFQDKHQIFHPPQVNF